MPAPTCKNSIAIQFNGFEYIDRGHSPHPVDRPLSRAVCQLRLRYILQQFRLRGELTVATNWYLYRCAVTFQASFGFQTPKCISNACPGDGFIAW